MTDRTKRLENGKKRCQAVSRLGFQCTKEKKHLGDLDVVHTCGLFLWRDTEPMFSRMTFTAPRVGIDTAMTGPNDGSLKVKFPGRWDGGDLGPQSKVPLCECPGCKDRRRSDHVRYGRDGTLTPTGEPCECSTCKYEQREAAARDEWGQAAKAFAEGDDHLEPIDLDETPDEQLADWWMGKANEEVERTVPKAIEYSATDLTDIGHDLARTAGREVSDEEAAELGVFFYLRGKMARWVGAVIAGQRVSDDTLFDIGVYVRMAQRIRETGSWPGTTEVQDETE